MPYSGPSDPALPENVQNMPANKRAQWVEVWNSVYQRCRDDGGSVETCEGRAFPQAYGVVNAAAEGELETVDIKGLEILRTGTWDATTGRLTVTRQMLDDMVESYVANKGAFEAPLKIGHTKGQRILQSDGLPAAGWLENLRRAGDKLIADIRSVPRKIADLIKAEAWRHVSIEARQDMRVDQKEWPWVVTGLSLLGADLPAVEGLNDITKLYAMAHLEPVAEEETVIVWAASGTDALDLDGLFADLDAIATRAERHIKSRQGAPVLRALIRKVKEELRSMTTKKAAKEDDGMDLEVIRKALGLPDDASDDDVLAQAAERLTARPEVAEPVAAEPTPDSELSRKLDDAQARVIALETERAREKAEVRVDRLIALGKLLPAQRDSSVEFALRSPDTFDGFMASQPSVIEFGERGASGRGSDVDFSEFAPTASQISIAKQFSGGDYTKDMEIGLVRENAAKKGVSLPSDFGKGGN